MVVWPQAQSRSQSEFGVKTRCWNSVRQWAINGADDLRDNNGSLGIRNFCVGHPDVEMLDLLIETVVASYPVDTTRIYLTGSSNGCSMATTYLAERSKYIAAQACFSFYGQYGLDWWKRAAPDYVPTSSLTIHCK